MTDAATLFATRSAPAFHALGTTFDETEKVTTSEFLAKCNLTGWNTRLEEIQAVDDSEVWVSPSFKVVRDNPFTAGQRDVMSVVGTRYRVYQNEALFAFGDGILDGGGQWVAGGALGNGRRVFGILRLGDDIQVGGVDAVGKYLLVATSHDGTLGLQAAVIPVRFGCMNALDYTLRGVKQKFNIRHTQSMEGRLSVARSAIDLTFKHTDALAVEANALYETAMTNAEFIKITTALYPKPEDEKKGALTRWENKVDLLGDIFNGSVSDRGTIATNVGIENTAWSGLNALTEAQDWFRTPRKGDSAANFAAASGMNAVVTAEKNRIHSAILSFAADKGAKVLV